MNKLIPVINMHIRDIIISLLLLFCANLSAQERAEVVLETTEGTRHLNIVTTL